MKKIGKYSSILLIFVAIIVGFICTFMAKTRGFYYFAVSVALIMVYSFFIFAGTVKKNTATIAEILAQTKDLTEMRSQNIAPTQIIPTGVLPTNRS